VKVGLFPATGKNVGLGHLKRCLAIAKALKNLSHEVEFILENDFFLDLIDEIKLPYHGINKQSGNYDIAIVDSYNIDENFLKLIKKKCKTLARIDDAFCLFKDGVTDILINCNPYGTESLYKGLLRDECQFIMGKDFVPMDENFCNLRKIYKLRNKIQNTTLTFGASQNLEIVKLICERIHDKSLGNVSVLNGTNLRYILSNSTSSRLNLMPLLNNVIEIFSKSDLVICSASTTCWQLCSVGIPFICLQTANNQKNNFEYIKKTEVGIAIEKETLQAGTLEREIDRMDLKRRQELYRKGRSLIDCNGADRVAKMIIDLAK